MAEGWAKALGSNGLVFESAGTLPAPRVNPFAVRAMAEKGIDLTSAFPKLLASIEEPIGLIVAVCSQAAEACPNPRGEFEVERWDLPDPASAIGSDDEVMEVFRACRDEIERRVRELIAKNEP